MMGVAIASRVESIEYTTAQHDEAPARVSVLRIRLENGAVIDVENGGFHLRNPALCVMAYLGVSPSTLDEAEGESLPYIIHVSGEPTVAPFVVTHGRRALKQEPWGPDKEAHGEGRVKVIDDS